jgi:Xaa-Pro aminopeptidase
VPVISHGTGHGIGLEVHEPPLLALKGPALVEGDVLTVEPGLYALGIGGIRVEDMVAVAATGCENFNSLHEGLNWG